MDYSPASAYSPGLWSVYPRIQHNGSDLEVGPLHHHRARLLANYPVDQVARAHSANEQSDPFSLAHDVPLEEARVWLMLSTHASQKGPPPPIQYIVGVVLPQKALQHDGP